jgi:hypothetical protein
MNAYYIFSGLENGLVPISGKITLQEIIKNEGAYKGSELIYALQEQEIITEMYKPTMVQVSRDNDSSVVIINRVSLEIYNNERL